MQKEIDRIAYKSWINSQLSVAKHYWWISINWKEYEFDKKEMEKLNDPNIEEIFPDLVCYK